MEAIALAAAAVRRPAWRLIIDGRDVTREISPAVTQVEYVDHAHGKSDELTLTLENRDGRWLGAWYPTKGDAVELHIGYAAEPLMPCGRFEIDELEASGPPDTLSVKALAAGIIPALRTKRSAGYDGQTLEEIARKVAARHELTLVGTIEPIHLDRATQHREPDLGFLTQIAERYGYVFNVRALQLIFYRVGELESAATVATITRTYVDQYVFKSKTRRVYRACVVTSPGERSKAVITGKAVANDVVTGDTLRLTERVAGVAQAEQRAAAALRAANKREMTGTLTLAGDPRLVAGSTVECKGFGHADGKYLVETSRHTMTRDAGYSVELELTSA